MQKFVPALKIALIVCVLFLAAVTVLSLVFGAQKPFWAVFPMLMGLLSLGLISTWTWATPDCPACGTRQPARRKPTSFRQLMLGGWTCSNCGTELDRNGKAIAPKAAP